MKKLISILMCFLLIGLVGCSSGNNSGDNSGGSNAEYEFVGDLFMDPYYITSKKGYSVTIKGKLKNTSERDFTDISIEFGVYDEEDNLLLTISDNFQGLPKGSTWQFKAKSTGYEVTNKLPNSYKVIKVEIK